MRVRSAGSRASSKGTTAVRCNSDSRFPVYSADRSSDRTRVFSENRSVSHWFVHQIAPTAATSS